MTSSTAASQSELKAAKVPLGWRDQCSACVPSLPSSLTLSGSLAAIARRRLLIPLNVCRKEKLYLPWECENERHVYEK